MKITVLNDLHLGVNRTGGTTAESAAALREFTHASFRSLLEKASNFIAINGDMFDSYQVPMMDVLRSYEALAAWLEAVPERRLALIPGNHDLSKNSALLGSFEFMSKLLVIQYPLQVRFVQGGGWVLEKDGVYAISHVANQSLFDLELLRVPDNAKFVLLHCNYDNVFAGQADHSLNLSRDQAREFTKRGVTLVLGHEHQGRTLMGDKLIITGNQFPTSVSDCLAHGDGQRDGTKYMLQIDGEDLELVPTWNVKQTIGGYKEIDWKDLSQGPGNADFIRIAGKASAAESADVIKAVSKFRQTHACFVVTNAVKVDAMEGMDELAESVEDIRTVNVIEMLLEQLDADQQAVVRSLLQENTNA